MLSYEIDKKGVDALVKSVVGKYKLSERYYLAKAKLLKTKRLYEWDRYSTIYPNLQKEFTWKKAQSMILDAFGVFDKLYDEAEDTKLKINLLAEKIQGSFATVFRQTAFYLFEEDINMHRRQKGELSAEEFGGYFQKRLQAMFGRGLTLTQGHKHWWMPVLHFYHYNFYVFIYAFGEALTLALYAKYKRQGAAFTKGYLEALKAGGSKSPVEITKMMGVDMSNPKFWGQGLALLEDYIDEFEQLARKV